MNAGLRDSARWGSAEDSKACPVPGARRFQLDRSGSGYRVLPVAILAIFLFIFQGMASAATTVTPQSPARYSVVRVGAPPTPPTTFVGTGFVRATAALAALPAAGTQQAGTAGMAGVPVTLPTCILVGCQDQYIVASPAGLVIGEFAESVTFTLPQPVAPPGMSAGFMVEMLVHTTAGWTAGQAYLATGTTPGPLGTTITLQLFVELGTPMTPTILSIQIVVDTCSTATSCP